jgi:hypothetical protein
MISVVHNEAPAQYPAPGAAGGPEGAWELYRNPGAPFSAPLAEHFTAGGRTRSGSKAMNSRSSALFWLIGSLRHKLFKQKLSRR